MCLLVYGSLWHDIEIKLVLYNTSCHLSKSLSSTIDEVLEVFRLAFSCCKLVAERPPPLKGAAGDMLPNDRKQLYRVQSQHWPACMGRSGLEAPKLRESL